MRKKKGGGSIDKVCADMPRADSQKVWTRRKMIKLQVCDGELADLSLIGAAWGCSPSQVVWCVVATWLNETGRDRDMMGLPYTKHSERILRAARQLEDAELEEKFG